MNVDWTIQINALCPLPIAWAAWEDPTLIIRGENWSFSCTSAWRMVGQGRMLAGCEDERAAEILDELRGEAILRCELITGPVLGDVRLVLTNGSAIEVFVAGTADPWILRLPFGSTLVPSPTDPEWFL